MHSRIAGRQVVRSRGESGHLLLLVMIGIIIMSIMLGAAVQQWSTVQRRENEEELIFRGNQYVKAIKRYQAEHGGALPTSLEILIEPGPRRLRYIRKLFRDPMVPDGKWGILLAHPSGKGYINPNAPSPTGEGEIPGLEDLGKGLRDSGTDQYQAYKTGGRTATGRSSASQSVYPLREESLFDEWAGKESVTAPGQPVGPIVGVVSLANQTSFRAYRLHENYTEWAFNIFEDATQGQTQVQTASPVPTPGSGVGPGAGFSVSGGSETIGTTPTAPGHGPGPNKPKGGKP